MSQQFSITVKQRVDGQIQVTRIGVPWNEVLEEPFIKEEMRHDMENKLEGNHIRVLRDVGIVEYD